MLVISKPIVAPVKGDKLRASWGAAVAERANECADAIDVLRGRVELVSKRDPKTAVSKLPYPFMVRFVRSSEDGATPFDGDLIIYIPAGSLSVNSAVLKSEEIPLAAYCLGDYESEADWYHLVTLPSVYADGDTFVVAMDFSYNPSESRTSFHGIGFSRELSGDVPVLDDKPGVINRTLVIANVTLATTGEGTPDRVKVQQVAKGPLVYEIGVRSLNGAMGDLSVVGDKNGVTIDGSTYWVHVQREEESSEIVVSISDNGPDENEKDGGYCNEISDEKDSTDDEQTGNSISDYGNMGQERPGNAISLWPCDKGEAT